MKRDDAAYLHHIRDAIERVERHLAGVSWDEFLQTELVQDVVLR